MTGSFTSNVATIIGGAKDMTTAVDYQISQMCPEFYGSGKCATF